MGAVCAKAGDKQVGEGTFATVCVVSKDDQGKAYAIKRLKRQSSVEEVGLFNKEIDILSSMDHMCEPSFGCQCCRPCACRTATLPPDGMVMSLRFHMPAQLRRCVFYELSSTKRKQAWSQV